MSDNDRDAIQNSEQKTQKSGASAEIVLYEDKIEIHAQTLLPMYHVGPNKAYSAFVQDKNKTSLIAIVCEPAYVPRLLTIPTYKNIINAHLAQLIESGTVYWPPAKQERYVLFYLSHLGKPILLPNQPPAMGWRSDDVLQGIIKPMLDVFQDFRDRDFIHGTINPTNMFEGMASGKTRKIILGDCLSTPPSFTQPVLYEPIERALTDPIAKGKGTQGDDFYAFGVSLAVALRTHDPLENMSDSEIVEQKILQGSYVAITGKDRFKGDILELLRGLLHDDPLQRWTLTEILSWMDGRRLSPKQSFTPKKAARPLGFHQKKYLIAPLLACALPENSTEVKKIVEDDSLPQWVERSMADEKLLERFEKVLTLVRPSAATPGYENRLVTYMSMALDPLAPLRYKDMALMGDGIGTALAEAVANRKSLTPYAEIFTQTLATNWLTIIENPNCDVAGLHTKFEHCRRFLRSNKAGEGLERVLYFLCPEVHCLSDTVRAYFVQEPGELLQSYEDLCKKNKAPGMFLDRHSIAFLLQKDSKVIEPFVFDLNSPERHKVILANLCSLALIQKRYDVKDVSSVVKLFGSWLPAVLLRYHDRTVREKMKNNIAECATNGDLQKMASLLGNQEIFKSDFQSFRKAMVEYNTLEKERFTLQEKMENKNSFGIETGKEWSAIIASALSGFAILVIALMFFSHKPIF